MEEKESRIPHTRFSHRRKLFRKKFGRDPTISEDKRIRDAKPIYGIHPADKFLKDMFPELAGKWEKKKSPYAKLWSDARQRGKTLREIEENPKLNPEGFSISTIDRKVKLYRGEKDE